MRKSVGLYVLMMLGVILPEAAPALMINTDGQKGVVRTLSATTFGMGTLNVGSGFIFAQSSDYFKGPVQNRDFASVSGPDGTPVIEPQIETARLFSSNIYLSVNPFSCLNFSISLPYYYDWSGISRVSDGGFGDLRLSSKIAIPSGLKGFYQGYFISGTIPVGMEKNGIFPRHSYIVENDDRETSTSFYSASSATLTGVLLLTLDIGAFQPQIPVQIHGNLGGSATSSNKNQRNLLLGNVAVEYSPVHFLTLFVDLSGEIRIGNLSADIKLTEDPILLTPGLKISTPAGLYLYLAGDFSLSSKDVYSRVNHNPQSGAAKDYAYSTGVIPSYGAQFILGWNGFMTIQDDDHDGIRNNVDRCPKDAEDLDGFEDKDGCPDLDNDKDGITDRNDSCTNAAEDKDGFNDDDGCPDYDNDGDGLVDIKDQCPNVAEDIDGFEDSDGCPDKDNDKDAVLDSVDKCPNEPEDFDLFQDDDGCPDPDNDKDGIVDVKDKCPQESETFNSFEDDDGCPDTVKKKSEIPTHQILTAIEFRNNGPEMTFNSYQFIEPLIRQLKQSPEVEIEIRGYSDTLGVLSKKLPLTQMRAEAVRQYLISKSINPRRIRAVGLGAANPIADNRTAAGRSQNRRIEVVRIK
jgi:outer membrane protein OmpA-like peptidoglycan-associated protein